MKEIRLYDYQAEMKERIEAAFRSYQSVMVQMPTGTGKTILLAEVVKSEERRVKNPDGEKSEKLKVKNPCVWIVVHRRELVEQIKASLTASLNVECEMLNATHNVKCEMLNVKRGKQLDSSLFTFPFSLNTRVFSIQWLSRHYQEMEERPSLIIIDEAHHAVAKTYKEVMDAYPEARKLGLTATPCRLNKHGFTDLFDVLLQSWSYNKFIADGWLSLYDYMSIREDSEDWRMVNSLKKRGADGDFSLREMSDKLNVQPSIERLCDTILRYAPNKKGIVYAIDIKHAEHIAEYYREHGLNAVAISSKTPLEERKAIIERFKGTNDSLKDTNYSSEVTNYHELAMNYVTNDSLKDTNCHEFKIQNSKNQNRLCRQFKIQNSSSGKRLYEPSATLNTQNSTLNIQHCLRQPLNIQHSTFNILINVDLFGEGFDCPDVEFIQLARPTLSLAKYLQQVGRGMRVFEGKKYCLILDNVGLYRLFGLPSDDRDWQAMFDGRMAGKGVLNDYADGLYNVAYSIRNEKDSVSSDARTELITVMTHEGQRMDLDEAYGYRVVGNGDGMSGVVDKDGKEVMPYIYNKVELKAYGIAKLYSRRRIDRERPWMDLRNGVRFFKRPRIEKHGFLEFSTTDGLRLYPRVKTRLMDENCFVLRNALDNGTDEGLRFRNFFVQPSEPDRLYIFKEKIEDLSIWEDDQGGLAWRKAWETMLHPMTAEELVEKRNTWEEDVKRFEEEKKLYIRFFKPVMNIDIIDGKTLLTDYKEPANTRITGGTNNNYQVFYRRSSLDKWESLGSYAKIYPQAYGIRIVQNREGKYLVRTELYEPMEKPEQTYEFAELQDNALLHFTEQGKEYWVYLENMTCFTRKPEFVTIGFMDFLKIGGVYMRRGRNNGETYRRAEIRMYDDICFLGSREVFVKTTYRQHHYYIQQRSLNGKHFVLSDSMNPKESSTWFDMYYDGKNPPIVERRKKDYEIYGVKK
ncbi:DEAD/DEAH box helicase [uncultured Prevotella sp.]|uniref:DEAD/DEAH box helicase n=1 Tax=uncultured Prevotella sp. TaxID=159272 RepID=UPI0025F94C67|nr:DEAD/DEAH box helicase [uncultured Prevotella sp.]